MSLDAILIFAAQYPLAVIVMTILAVTTGITTAANLAMTQKILELKGELEVDASYTEELDKKYKASISRQYELGSENHRLTTDLRIANTYKPERDKLIEENALLRTELNNFKEQNESLLKENMRIQNTPINSEGVIKPKRVRQPRKIKGTSGNVSVSMKDSSDGR